MSGLSNLNISRFQAQKVNEQEAGNEVWRKLTLWRRVAMQPQEDAPGGEG